MPSQIKSWSSADDIDLLGPISVQEAERRVVRVDDCSANQSFTEDTTMPDCKITL